MQTQWVFKTKNSRIRELRFKSNVEQDTSNANCKRVKEKNSMCEYNCSVICSTTKHWRVWVEFLRGGHDMSLRNPNFYGRLKDKEKGNHPRRTSPTIKVWNVLFRNGIIFCKGELAFPLCSVLFCPSWIDEPCNCNLLNAAAAWISPKPKFQALVWYFSSSPENIGENWA